MWSQYWTNNFFEYLDKDEEPELISRNRKPISFDAFEEVDNNVKPIPLGFMVYEDNNTPADDKIIKIKQKEMVKNTENVYVYTDEDDQAKSYNEPSALVENNDKNQVKNNEFQVFIDTNDENDGKVFKIPDVYVDNDENVFSKKSSKINQFMGKKENSIKGGSKVELKDDKNFKLPIQIQNYNVYEDESYESKNTEKQINKTKDNSINLSSRGKSPLKKIERVG